MAGYYIPKTTSIPPSKPSPGKEIEKASLSASVVVGALVEDHQHHNAPQSNNAPNSNNAPHSNNAKTQQEEYQIAVALVNNILADQDRGDKEDGDDRIDGQNGEDRGQVTDEGNEDEEQRENEDGETDAQNENNYEYKIVKTYIEMREAVKKHSEETNSKFCVCKRTRKFGTEVFGEIGPSRHRFLWNDPRDRQKYVRHEFFNYDGVPYLTVGTYHLGCHYGAPETEGILKRREHKRLLDMQEKNLKPRGRRVSKKCGCPATIYVRQVVKFPQYKIQRESNYKKREAVRKLRDDFKKDSSKIICDFYYILRLPKPNEHKFHELISGTEKKKHEILHTELRIMAQELVFSNFKITAIHEKLYQHVVNNWYYGKEPPDRESRIYFPRKVVIRNLRERLFQLCLFSGEDLVRIDEIVEKLKIERPADNVWLEVKCVDEEDDEEIFLETEDLNLLEESEENTPSNATGTNSKTMKNVKKVNRQFHAFNFVYQNAWQQRILQRYGRVAFITEVKHNHIASRALTFKIFLVLVQTNVDYQIVGVILHSKIKGATSLSDCLERFKSFSMQWAPKYFFVDVSEPIFAAIESVFPDAEYFLSPTSCREKWKAFFETPSHELKEHSTELLGYLAEMQRSYTKDILNTSANVVESSDVWKNSIVLREWFQTVWLPLAKRWVNAYRPGDIIVLGHGHGVFEESVKSFSNHVSSVTTTMQHYGFFNLLETIVNPEETKIHRDRYFYLNKARFSECVLLQSHFQIEELIGVPLALFPVFNTLKIEYEECGLFQVEEQQYGVYKVGETSSSDSVSDEDHIVSFGGNVTFPSCTCVRWHQTHLPCIHMYAIFRNNKECKYDTLSALYRINPLLDFDYSTIDGKRFNAKDNLKFLAPFQPVASKSCQTGICMLPKPSTQNLVVSQPSSASSKRSVFKEAAVFDEVLLGNLKELQLQLNNLKGAFVDTNYEKSLSEDLSGFIRQMENCGKRPSKSNNKDNSKKGSLSTVSIGAKENKEATLRHTNTQFISMSSFKKTGTPTHQTSTQASLAKNGSLKKTINLISSPNLSSSTSTGAQRNNDASPSPKKQQRVVKIAKVKVGLGSVIKSMRKDNPPDKQSLDPVIKKAKTVLSDSV